MNNLRPCLMFLWVTLKHKYFVFVAGLRTGAPLWRLVIHDWSKFLPSEAWHYGRQFYGDASEPQAFNRAWLLHQNRHPHHWEYWLPRTSGVGKRQSGQRFGRYLLRDDRGLVWIVDTFTGERVGYYVAKSTAAALNGHSQRRPGPALSVKDLLTLPEHADIVVQMSVIADFLNDHVPMPLPMPEWAAREMVADWMGASRAYDGRWPTAAHWPWWEAKRDVIHLHPATRAFVEILIGEVLK